MTFKCKICKCFRTKDALAFYHHLRTHKISTKDYYDKFLKKENEDKCKYCGKQTRFATIALGYREFCSTRCASIGTQDRKIKTCLKNRGTEYPTQSSKVRNKCKKTWMNNLGVDNPSKSVKIKNKKERTCLKHFGVSCSFLDEEVKRKSKKTLKKNYNVTHPMYSPLLVNKLKKSNLKKYGVDCVLKSEEIKNKIRKNNLKKYGVECSSQREDVREKIRKSHLKKSVRNKIFSHLKKENNGYLSKSEYEFSKLLHANNISFKKEYLLKNEKYFHHFDFAIFKKDKLKCLVEIDGRYYHGLYRDFNGIHSKESKDYLRWSLVPSKVKFLVIDDNKLEKGIKELLRILPMKYKDWKKEMIRSIPKNIEDAIPKYKDIRMKSDWNCLCTYKYSKGAFLGKSILLNFCRSRIINLLGEDWKTLRKTLYKSPCSEHNVLEGLDDFRNTSKLREKYRKKYKGCDTILVKHHSPEKMLAICSLGKNYVSKEPISNESVKIIKYLNLNAYEINNN